MYHHNNDQGAFAAHVQNQGEDDDHHAHPHLSSDAEDIGPLGSPTRISYAASAASSSTLSVPAAHGFGGLGTPSVGSTRVGRWWTYERNGGCSLHTRSHNNPILADRLLMHHRIRKTQSNPVLCGPEGDEVVVPSATEPASLTRVPSCHLPQQQQRLIVVANRLPVSAVKRKGGGWSTHV